MITTATLPPLGYYLKPVGEFSVVCLFAVRYAASMSVLEGGVKIILVQWFVAWPVQLWLDERLTNASYEAHERKHVLKKSGAYEPSKE